MLACYHSSMSSDIAETTQIPLATRFRAAAVSLPTYTYGMSAAAAHERYGEQPTGILRLAANENPWGTSPRAQAAAQKALTNAHRYPSPEGEYAALRAALANYLSVDPTAVTMGPGSGAIIRYLAQLFVEPGDEVVVPQPTFASYAIAARLMGGVVRSVPLINYHADVDALAQAVTERTRIIWLCSPHNPTGTIVTHDQAERLLQLVPRTVAVVFDHAYNEFADDPRSSDATGLLRAGWENVIALGTLSKAFGLAALRVGYAVAHRQVCQIIERLREPFHLSGPACAAACAALDDREWLNDCVRHIREERTRLARELSSLGCEVVPSQANFLLVDAHIPAAEIHDAYARAGVLVRRGDLWGYATHVRITVGTPDDNDRVIEVMQALRRARCRASPRQ